jgi:hypothetical protein
VSARSVLTTTIVSCKPVQQLKLHSTWICIKKTTTYPHPLGVWTDRRHGTVAADAKRRRSPVATDGDEGHKRIESNRFAQKLGAAPIRFRPRHRGAWDGRTRRRARRRQRTDGAAQPAGDLSAAPLSSDAAPGSSASARRGAPHRGARGDDEGSRPGACCLFRSQ